MAHVHVHVQKLMYAGAQTREIIISGVPVFHTESRFFKWQGRGHNALGVGKYMYMYKNVHVIQGHDRS